MNQKRAKEVRRLARQLTPDNPARVYGLDRRTGSVMNHPKSTRGVYRMLKGKV